MILARVAEETQDLARSVDSLHFLAEWTEPSLRRDHGRFIQSGQEIDIVIQRLDGLSTFLSALCSAVPADWMLDIDEATGKLSLSALVRRLAGKDAPLSVEQAPGELDLF